MAGPGVVGMAVGDHGPLDGADRIDMETARFAAQTGSSWQQDVLWTHVRYIGGPAPIFTHSNRTMPVRLFQSSGDMMADRRFEFARDLQLKGDLPAAADLLLQAIELAPNFTTAWFMLGNIREQLGERDVAIAAFRNAHAADADDRHGAGLRLMRLGAAPVAAMTQGYVQTLFDQYAPRFELALVDGLDYRGPELLFRAVLSVRAAARRPAFFKRAIDLGCGTGLAATAFAKEVDHFIGIDLSPRMIERARSTGFYAELEVADMVQGLRTARPMPVPISFWPRMRWSMSPISRRCLPKPNAF